MKGGRVVSTAFQQGNSLGEGLEAGKGIVARGVMGGSHVRTTGQCLRLWTLSSGQWGATEAQRGGLVPGDSLKTLLCHRRKVWIRPSSLLTL